MRRGRSATSPRPEPPDDSSELALVRAVQDDLRLFPLLFDRYWLPVRAYSSYRLANREDAEDAAQQVMIEVSRALGRFHTDGGHGSFRSWVFNIAHAKTIDARRSGNRICTDPFPDGVHWRDPGPTPEEETTDTASRAWLLAMLDHLDDNEREVLELRAAELTTAEIAAVLQISEENTRQRTKRARDHLRTLLMHTTGGWHA